MLNFLGLQQAAYLSNTGMFYYHFPSNFELNLFNYIVLFKIKLSSNQLFHANYDAKSVLDLLKIYLKILNC